MNLNLNQPEVAVVDLKNAALVAVAAAEAVVVMAAAVEAVAAVVDMAAAAVETVTVADSTEEAIINLPRQTIKLKTGICRSFLLQLPLF